LEIRKIILTRISLIYFFLLVFSLAVVVNLISVQKIKNDRWEQIEKNLKSNTLVIEPKRGNICAEDGNMLATSIPGYYIRIDLKSEGVKRVFAKERDSLAYYMSRFFRDVPASEYKRRLNVGFKQGDRDFMLTPRRIDYNELQKMRKFPILKRGRFGGGMIIEEDSRRINPLGALALRTIGGLNKGAGGGAAGAVGNTGLEGSFEKYLRGEDGVGYRQNLSGRWMERVEIQPEDGMDIITTINIKMQDITESALLKQLMKSDADWATAILMEVETGQIKAIANLGKGKGGYYEKDNYALGPRGCYEPGSTFKLISLMVAIEDGLIDTSDVIDTGNGIWVKSGRKITDTHGYGRISVKRIFENSSNIGVAKIITTHYEKNPKKYVDGVYKFGVNKPLDLQIAGEGEPFFKYPGDSDWWGTTLAGMSYGYESKMTPLQILNFYNAVANDGKMVKPFIVKEIRDNGALVERYGTEVINSKIASRRTIRIAQELLKGVCLYGTGKDIKSDYVTIAGKTGTARVATSSKGYSEGMYLASFAGFFPADDPLYSLIVTFNNPRGGYYGSSVAGPVFKEIAEKVYSSKVLAGEEELEEIEEEDRIVLADIKKGSAENILEVVDELDVKHVKGSPDSDWANVETKNNKIYLTDNKIVEGTVPNVKGMGATSAVFLLESAGLHVKITGIGRVKKQSINPGSKFKPGQTVFLTLG